MKMEHLPDVLLQEQWHVDDYASKLWRCHPLLIFDKHIVLKPSHGTTETAEKAVININYFTTATI